MTQEFTIDMSTWRCGSDSSTKGARLGEGNTALQNSEGFMCCLGQMCEQLGVLENDLLYLSPLFIAQSHPEHKDKLKLFVNTSDTNELDSTVLANEAMGMNDNVTTTIDEKVKSLTKLFADHGVKLRFINDPRTSPQERT